MFLLAIIISLYSLYSFASNAAEEALKHPGYDSVERGKKFYEEGNFQLARKFFMCAAKSGCPAAYTYLGAIYYYGLEVQQNYRKAYAWFNKAAAYDCIYAHAFLGEIYLQGLGTKKDIIKAIIYFRVASEHHEYSRERLQYIFRVQAEKDPLASKISWFS
jgi:TPR repeat protein